MTETVVVMKPIQCDICRYYGARYLNSDVDICPKCYEEIFGVEARVAFFGGRSEPPKKPVNFL